MNGETWTLSEIFEFGPAGQVLLIQCKSFYSKQNALTRRGLAVADSRDRGKDASLAVACTSHRLEMAAASNTAV